SGATGMAAMILLARLARADIHESLGRLDRARLFSTLIEAVVFVVFLISLGGLVGFLFKTVHGLLFIVGVAVLGILAPLAMELRERRTDRHRLALAAIFVLAGGLLLRWGLL